MNHLAVIERNNQRVMTTAVLAEEYGTTKEVISNNFNRNKERYTKGKHFYCLEGEEKRMFLNHHQIEDGSKNATKLYLWTEKGAFLHAKSLGTDRAWEVYETLVDTYFKVRKHQKPLTALEIAKLSIKAIEEVEARVDTISEDFQAFKMDMPLLALDCDRITAAVKRKGVELLGGKESPAYRDLSVRQKLYSDIHREVKRQFGVTSYKAIKRNQCDVAVDIINAYKPPMMLLDAINSVNAQLLV